jgi:hypothetical protein
VQKTSTCKASRGTSTNCWSCLRFEKARSTGTLERLHEPLYVRLTRRIDPSRLRTLERRGLVAAAVFMVGASGLALANANVVDAVSRFQWPVMMVGGLTFAAGLAKAFEIWIKGDHSRIRRGLTAILFVSLSQLAIVTVGIMADLYVAASMVESAPAQSDHGLPSRRTGW